MPPSGATGDGNPLQVDVELLRPCPLCGEGAVGSKPGTSHLYGCSECETMTELHVCDGTNHPAANLTRTSRDGLLTMQDLTDHTSTWVDPIHTDYRGYRVA